MTSRNPPSRRNPEFIDQRQSRQLQSMSPGALTGRLASAQPVNKLPGAPDALFGFDGGSGGASAAVLSPYWDEFTLASNGAQDVTLSFVPVEMSEHVYLRGVEQGVSGTFWTRDSLTLSLTSAADARTGDTLTVKYLMREEQSDPISDESELNVPFQSGGWSYIGVTSAGQVATYVDPATDASSWAEGTAPLGWSTFVDIDGHAKATSLPNVNTGQLGHVYDAVIRRDMPAGNDIEVTYDVSNYVGVYVDGTVVASSSTGAPAKATVVVGDMPAAWVLALYVTVANGYTDGGIDVQVTGTLP